MQRFKHSAQDLDLNSWQLGSGKRGLEPPSPPHAPPEGQRWVRGRPRRGCAVAAARRTVHRGSEFLLPTREKPPLTLPIRQSCRKSANLSPEGSPTSSQSLGAGLLPRASPVHWEGVWGGAGPGLGLRGLPVGHRARPSVCGVSGVKSREENGE